MHQQKSPSARSQSGNAMWFILVAIALLVALTVTVTKSGENTEENGQRDRDRILASDIMRQAKSIESAVQQMRLMGIPENDISFENSFISNAYNNPKCLNDSCRLFAPGGAGLAYKKPPAAWLEPPSAPSKDLYGQWYFFATACIPDVGTGGVGCGGATTASSVELIAALPWISKNLCIELNRMNGVKNTTNPVAPPKLSGTAYTAARTQYEGVFSQDSEISNADDAFKGKSTGCFQGDSEPSGGYHFYHVLIPR